jgi:hypothetical protein
MIRECDSDVVCLQEVQCSNASCAEPKSEQLIGGNIKDDARVDKLLERIKGFLKSNLGENSSSSVSEHQKLCDALSGKVFEPATVSKCQKHLKMLYDSPTPQNVKIVIVKKMKIPIFVDGSDIRCKWKQHQSGAAHLPCTDDEEKKNMRQAIASKIQSIEELQKEKKWIESVALSDKPVEQRRHDLLRDPSGSKGAVQIGDHYFLLVVIKAGTVQTGCKLEYALPDLPIYQQIRTQLITVQRIIDLNHIDGDASDGGKTHSNGDLPDSSKLPGGAQAKQSTKAKSDKGKSQEKPAVSAEGNKAVGSKATKSVGGGAAVGGKGAGGGGRQVEEQKDKMKEGRVKCVEKISVRGSDLESVALIQVFALPGLLATALTFLQVSQSDFALVQEMAVQTDEGKSEEDRKKQKNTNRGFGDIAKRRKGSGFLYSPEAYTIELELRSSNEDCIHEIMNCPLADGSSNTLGYLYDVVFLANCQPSSPKDSSDEPQIKRISSQRLTQKVSSTYGIAVLYVVADRAFRSLQRN